MIAIFPELAGLAMEKDFERLACCVRKYFADRQLHAPIVDVKAIAQRAGISLKDGQIDEFAALLIRDERGQFEVSLIQPAGLDQIEERVLCAHLLGHFFLHGQLYIARNEGSRWGVVEKQLPHHRSLLRPSNSQDLDRDQQLDWEADAFAYALLMPSGMVRRAKEKLKSIERLSAFFGVSQNFASARLHQLDENSSISTALPKVKSNSQAGQLPMVESQLQNDLYPDQKEPLPRGLKRLRQLARSMDSSVKL